MNVETGLVRKKDMVEYYTALCGGKETRTEYHKKYSGWRNEIIIVKELFDLVIEEINVITSTKI